MKIMIYKRTICLIMTICLIINIFVISNAKDNSFLHPLRSNEEWARLQDNKIEFDEIDDLVHEYNVYVKNNWNKYEYGKTSDDIANTYYDASDALSAAASSADSDVATAMAEAQSYGLQELGDNNLNDSEVNKLTYMKAEENKVLEVKKIYVNYFIEYLNYEIAKNNLEEGKKAYESGKRSFEVGALTQVNLLSLEKNIYTLEANELSTKNSYENMFKNLLVETGFSINANPDLDLPREVGADEIVAINLQDDINKAKINNYDLQILYKKLNNATTTELQNEQQNKINSADYFIEYDVNNKYNQLVNQFNLMFAKYNSYTAKERDFQKSRQEYLEGKRSLRSLETELCNLNNSLYDYIQSKYTLLIKKLDYDYAVKGLASVG